MNFLESQGWRVLVFSSMKGHILIDDFKKFEKLIVPSLYFSPSCYRKSEVRRTIFKIISEVGEYDPDETIIESDIYQRAVWAELVASQLKCRHLCMLVQEKLMNVTDQDSLLSFKYDRHELSCITKNAIQMLFGEDIQNVRADAYFRAYCNNVVLDVPDKYSVRLDPRADLTLGSLGRLDKPCVPFIVKVFCKYAVSHPDKHINIVMIGGAAKKGTKKRIRKALGKFANVNLVLTDNVYPVPMSLVKSVNVFVSTAGASNATYNVGIPTVKVHPLTGDPIGVIGLDYMPGEKSMYDSLLGVSLEKCIDNALNKKNQIRFIGDNKAYDEKMRTEFKRQLTFIDYTDKKVYYPEEKLMRIRTSSHYPYFVLWLIGHFFGGKGQTILWRLLKN